MSCKRPNDWYEEQAPGLGADLVQSVDACVETICRHPKLYPAIYRRVRQGVVARFPYSVFYLAAGKSLIVISVFHNSRDPQIWKRRL